MKRQTNVTATQQCGKRKFISCSTDLWKKISLNYEKTNFRGVDIIRRLCY